MIQAPAVPAPEIRLLALGDSYTIGESVDPNERWPLRLATMLRARGVSIAEPVIIAQTGWTTDELAAAIDANPPSGTFELVTLLIGVNNQYRGRPASEYRTQFGALLDRAIAFAGGQASRVIVVAIPDWGVTPYAHQSGRDLGRIATEIDAFNAIGREESAGKGAFFVDIAAVSRRAAVEPALVASDGLHPSGSMYEEWARLIFPVALAAIDHAKGR